MRATDYLIVGSSHAALEAVNAIRMHDAAGTVTLVTRDRHLPYSPTILPYVVSGRSEPRRTALRDEAWFADRGVTFVRGDALLGIHPDDRTALFNSGDMWRYGRLLLATGARPLVPDIDGLKSVPYHVLRTLDDAVGMRAAGARHRRAAVIGAGLIGMHAAENLMDAGMEVTVVERGPRVLPAYFGGHSARAIQETFAARGLRVLVDSAIQRATRRDDGTVVLTLGDGGTVEADMLVVATGVSPETRFLAGSDIATGRTGGILVDDHMRTGAPHIWAAGDVAEARAFSGGTAVTGILPSAVDQGRIAGADMAGDRVGAYAGGLPMNTYTFFGRRAVSVGDATAEGDDVEVFEQGEAPDGPHRRMVLRDNRLIGASAIDEPMDGGILSQLILRRVDLSPVRDAFLANPRDTARGLMSRLWR